MGLGLHALWLLCLSPKGFKHVLEIGSHLDTSGGRSAHHEHGAAGPMYDPA